MEFAAKTPYAHKPSRKRVAASLAMTGFAAFVLNASVAQAEGTHRIDARQLSCSAVHNIIDTKGAVILKSKSATSGRLLSERYVAHRGFCFANEITEYRTVSAGDTNTCSVKLCSERRDRDRFRNN